MDGRPTNWPAPDAAWDLASSRRAELCEPATNQDPPARPSMAPVLFGMLLFVVCLALAAHTVHVMAAALNAHTTLNAAP